MKKRLYEDYDYENEYKKELKKKSEVEDLRLNNNYVYMRKTITSGNVVECEIYPVWKCKSDMPRKRTGKTTRKAQKNLNDKNRRKTIVRYINNNFGAEDIFLTLTYPDGYIPTEERALKDMKNYIAKVRRRRKKDGIKEPFKYIYVISYDNDPENSTAIRIHHHIIMSKMNRDVAEELWNIGRANSKRLQPDDFGLEGVARYMAQQPQKKKDQRRGKRFGHSTNLKKPKITYDRTTLTNRRAENMILKENDYKEYFEKRYKNCDYLDCKTYKSDLFPGVYFYARLRKRE